LIRQRYRLLNGSFAASIVRVTSCLVMHNYSPSVIVCCRTLWSFVQLWPWHHPLVLLPRSSSCTSD
jgi:hypothetical protein